MGCVVVGLCKESILSLLILTLSLLCVYRLIQLLVQGFIRACGIGWVVLVELERFLNWWLLLSQLKGILVVYPLVQVVSFFKELSLFKLTFKSSLKLLLFLEDLKLN